MFACGYAAISDKKDYVDSLNVFPVPDGDTGINMTLTMKSILTELEGMASNELSQIVSAISKGGLKGARGNSGVILSQIFKGMMTELLNQVDPSSLSLTKMVGMKQGTARAAELTTKQFSKALMAGAKTAYSAVTVPKEGTILTVLRVMAEESVKIAKSESDFIAFFKALLQVGEDILAQTPEMLPVLKKAGVVDSGGRGLIIIFGGMLGAIDGSSEVTFDFSKDGKLSLGATGEGGEEMSLDEIEFAYCTEFNVTNMHKMSTMASIDALRDQLCVMGDSVVCVGDLEMVKCHVHTNSPGNAITAALNLGEIINLKVDNMLQQNRELRAAHNIEEKDQGIVAIAAGDGVVSVFKDLGVDYVIKGGQTMNPCADSIAKACDRVHAKTVFVFPNNKNIILAAQHAADLCHKNLVVIPTKTINEGISACIAFDDQATVEENTDAFHAAALSVKSGCVTYAVRNTRLDRFSIKEGEVLGLNTKTVLAKGTSIPEVTTKLVEKLINGKGASSITLFYGEGIKEKDANSLHDKLMDQYPDMDVNMINGGQPVYYYLISVE